MKKETLNIAFYQFGKLSDLNEKKKDLKKLCAGLGLLGTILLSPEGINCFLAGPIPSIEKLLDELLRMQVLKGSTKVQKSFSTFIPFRRLYVKIKKEIIPSLTSAPFAELQRAPVISPEGLKEWLDEGKPVQLLDTRNSYEIQEGAFKGSIQMPLKHFRELPEKLRIGANERLNPNLPLVMYCTGGIRCEKASSVALEAGFKEVYQLQGGILNYFRKCGLAHYEGKCFVFDERVAIDPDDLSNEPVK